MVFLQLGREEKHAFAAHGITEKGLIKRAERMKVQLIVKDEADIVLKKSA
jgi:hypothetical protein